MLRITQEGGKTMFGITPEGLYILPAQFLQQLNSITTNKHSIKNVIFNNPATIVYWNDGTKTVVKCNNEKFDKEKGLAMAICKKAMGNKGNYNDIFRKWITEKGEK